MILQLPIAWLQLARQRVRFLVALAGIAFIVVLIFMQMGFNDSLYTSATKVHQIIKGDLFLISSQYKSLTAKQSFPRERLYQALGFNGVESVSPLYLRFAKFKNPITDQKYSIYVIGFDPGKPVLNSPEVNQNLDLLKLPNVVLFDRKSRPDFGPIAENFEQGNTEQTIEIFGFAARKGYRVKVGGLFSLGPSFGVDGNLVVGDSTLFRIFNLNSEMVDVGVINLKPDADHEIVLQNLKNHLSQDVLVFSYQEFIDFEKDYWQTRTPVGFILGMMLFMASVVGIVIVYQILHSNISTNLVAYATLKAIGYPNQYLLSVVFQQSVILAVLAYIPGLAISIGLYNVVRDATGLPMEMRLNQASIVLIVTILMCFASGVLAVNKMRSADPADIF
ncbi:MULTISPECIES: ABC transporter permease DevC [unclassified Moorena]|uniref:ABC transporter permease DevC n=1 Tax=unclassified Moorena TaxID=2683338 RepID=UPI00140072E6|nr:MULTISPECIES: ABC transporter permease DevC [unclassified Moorena]NEO10832.1 FtsX-like permease family protein [Moorena sp. SIO3E8]NEP97477.1 FtsX-like permease family protein [Moorena sp. SIO3F7]